MMADTCTTVVLGGAGGGASAVAPQGAVGAGAGRSSLTGGFFSITLGIQKHKDQKYHTILLPDLTDIESFCSA